MLAETDEDKARYPYLASQMDRYGYLWESYSVETEDGWILALLRVYGMRSEDGTIVTENSN